MNDCKENIVSRFINRFNECLFYYNPDKNNIFNNIVLLFYLFIFPWLISIILFKSLVFNNFNYAKSFVLLYMFFIVFLQDKLDEKGRINLLNKVLCVLPLTLLFSLPLGYLLSILENIGFF